MLEFSGLFISMYEPGPGLGALIYLLQGLTSLAPKGTVTVSSYSNLYLISSLFLLLL
jgi:hypothetical protein